MTRPTAARFVAATLAAIASFIASSSAAAQGPELTDWSVLLSRRYAVSPNVTYLEVDGWEGRADVYRPTRVNDPVPTVLFFHGGGWIRGEKEGPVLHLMPYIAMGFAVINVEYRVAPEAKAPAAVQDARCALHWVFDNAERLGFDTTRVITTGHSAGGHLALMTGLLSAEDGLDTLCPGADEPKVAAIVNWYGITDVADVLEGPNREAWAEEWIGTDPSRERLVRNLSPLTHVDGQAPPILSIHGDQDETVPHQHAVRLHSALQRAGAPHELLTIEGVGHGGLSEEQLLTAYATVRDFLERHGIYRPGDTAD